MDGHAQKIAALVTSSLLANPAIIPVDAQSPSQHGKQPASATRPMTQQEIDKARAGLLDALLHGPSQKAAALAHDARGVCLTGNVPALVAEIWQKDLTALPPVDECIGALTRQGTDGQMYSVYKEMIDNANAGKPGTHKATDDDARVVVQAITDGIKAGDNDYDITQSEGRHIQSGLALDAGFTAAWSLKGQGLQSLAIKDVAKVHAATEQCTTQQGDPKACFIVGLAQGAKAYQDTHPKLTSLETGDFNSATRTATGRGR